MNLASGLRVYETRKGEWFLARSVAEAVATVLRVHQVATEAEAKRRGLLSGDGPRELSDLELRQQPIDVKREGGRGLMNFAEFLEEIQPEDPDFFASVVWDRPWVR
ncbi:hypothetical protein SAMN05421819_3544 [Bryocella elongata]|uniref:Uncharacterized protein n=1 Tax=Bryocella elongata TaxID=863522 RepID=A0A1H6B5I6_9BACT|nr:hypothetical protein [Bryocella elongata]SEG56099.1 hypothetical protein SAMN05421819_3544 [Bryocella elongata]